MKATAIAPANIAFIKYWGKKDDSLRLPANSSFSMNLSGAFSVTTVEFSRTLASDDVSFEDGGTSQETARITSHLDHIRKRADMRLCARVKTKNSFPKGAGAASSASGFAALTLAGTHAAGLRLSEKELTILARIGSGSACRSIPDGYVIWEEGNSSETSFAYSLYPSSYWALCDVLVIVDAGMKKISTSEGHEGAATSPFFTGRISVVPERMERMKKYFAQKDFQSFGILLEEECLDMHRVMQTQTTPLHYWNETTKIIMNKTRQWRRKGLPVYFTIDAGPNVHLICEQDASSKVLELSRKIAGVKDVIYSTVAKGARIISEHLFD